MSEWRECELGDVVADVGGSIKTGPFGTTLKAAEYSRHGMPVLSVGEIGHGRLDVSDSTPRVDAGVSERLSEYVLLPRDIVVARKGAVERSALIPESSSGYFLGSDGLRIRLDQGVLARFVAYQMQSRVAREWLLRHAAGSTLLSMNQTILARLPIRIPPEGEQRAIADLLAALDDKIEANRKLAATAGDLSAAIVRAVCDPDRVDRLGDVAEITMGSSPKGETMNNDGDGVPFYQGVRDFGLRFPARRVWTTAPIRTAAAGDILVSVRAPVGTVNYAPEALCIGRGLAAVRSRTGQQSTLFHLLHSARRAWAEYDSGGTVFGSINRDQLHSIEIPVIQNDAVERREAEVANLELRLSSALREGEHLAALRDTLLPRLMSGELRVREAERLVADAV